MKERGRCFTLPKGIRPPRIQSSSDDSRFFIVKQPKLTRYNFKTHFHNEKHFPFAVRMYCVHVYCSN